MTAPVPRIRKIGEIAYASNTFGADLLSPNGFPLLVYEGLRLRLSGTLTVAGGNNDGVATPENPFSLIKSIQLVVAGISGDTFIDIPFKELEVLSHRIMRRPGLAATNTAADVVTTGANAFSADVWLPFAFDDMSNPYRGFFASNRYSNVRLRVQWGSETDLEDGTGTDTYTLSSTKLEAYGIEYSFDQRFELAKDLLLHQRNRIKDVSLDAVAQTGFDIEIPRSASFLRGLLLKQYTQAAGASFETPVATLITATQQVSLIYNDTDRKLETTWGELQSRNADDYRLALPTGYVFLDLSPRGDFSLLQNMLNLQKIALRIDNASVADAFLKIVSVKYTKAA